MLRKSIIGNGYIHFIAGKVRDIWCVKVLMETNVWLNVDWIVLTTGFIDPGIALSAPYIRQWGHRSSSNIQIISTFKYLLVWDYILVSTFKTFHRWHLIVISFKYFSNDTRCVRKVSGLFFLRKSGRLQ